MEPQDLGAHLAHLLERVGDEDRGRAAVDNLAHFGLALFAEGPVADREHLVQNEDIRLYKAGDGKGQTGLHAGGELLEGPVLEILELSKVDDLVVLLVHELARIAQHCAAEVGIFLDGELPVEAAGKLKQGGDRPLPADPALGGYHDAGHVEGEAHVLVGPELRDMVVAGEPAHDVFLEADVLEVAGDVPDGYVSCFQNCHHVTSHIVQELMVILLVHPAAKAKGDERLRRHQQVIVPGEQGGVDDDHAEVLDDEVHRVCQEDALHLRAEVVHGIEDCGHVHQKLREDAPEVLHVPEEDKQGRQDQPEAEVQEYKAADRVQQQDKAPAKRDMVERAEHKEYAQREAEVDEALDVLGKEEEILRDVDLGEDAGVACQGGHALVGGLAEEREHQVPAEEEDGVMRRRAAEKAVNTSRITSRCSSGDSTLHAMPSTVRLYFVLKSRLTSSSKRNW